METASQITRDAVTTISKTASEDLKTALYWNFGTDIQKESQKRPNQARDGKDKVKSKP
ncbi:hypothetical protein Tco_1570987, partial [Tanacetum coccineum]